MRFSLTVFSALFVTAWGSMLLDRQASLPGKHTFPVALSKVVANQ